MYRYDTAEKNADKNITRKRININKPQSIFFYSVFNGFTVYNTLNASYKLVLNIFFLLLILFVIKIYLFMVFLIQSYLIFLFILPIHIHLVFIYIFEMHL